MNSPVSPTNYQTGQQWQTSDHVAPHLRVRTGSSKRGMLDLALQNLISIRIALLRPHHTKSVSSSATVFIR